MSKRDRHANATFRALTASAFGQGALEELTPQLDAGFWVDQLPRFRWFGDKGRSISAVKTRIGSALEREGYWLAFLFLEANFSEGAPSTWFTPLVFEPKLSKSALMIVVDGVEKTWYGSDAAAHPVFHRYLLEAADAGAMTKLVGNSEIVWNTPNTPIDRDPLVGRLISGEQSNSSIVYGDSVIIKIMRRVSPGLNPDVELGRYLTRNADIDSVPPLIADWVLRTGDLDASIGLAQEFVPNALDGWTWLLAELKKADRNPARQASIIDAIQTLGVQTAELHQALASATEPGIAPESITADDLTGWTRGTLQMMDSVGDALAQVAIGTRDSDRLRLLEATLNAWPLIGVGVVGHEASSGLMKIRVHGDFHLGQTLLQGYRWRIIDFEGEPARSLDERRARFSPLKDVAGMLRSIDYAKAMIIMEERGWLDESNALNDAFISGYRSAISIPGLVPATEDAFLDALKPWVIDKAMYEILYELNNRPDWLVVPVAALLRYTFKDQLGEFVARASDATP